jgi:transposase
MERKVKYTYEFKLRCVEEVLKKHQTVVATAKENDVALTGLKWWIRCYIALGKEGLLPSQKNANYSIAFKLKVLQAIEKKTLSLGQACLTFNIPARSTIISWQRRYAKEGLAGLKLKPIGRPVSMNIKRKKRKSDQPLSREEELLRELECLRAENEILKKFNALVQAEQAKQNKRLKP